MYWVLRAAAFIVSQLSDRSLERLAGWLAFFGFDVLRLRRKIILQNLTIAFGGHYTKGQRIVIGRASYRSFILTVFEFMRGFNSDIVQDTKFPDVALLRKFLVEDGKGCIFLCMHMGNWEAMGAAISRLVTPAHVIVKPVGSGGVDRFVAEVRKKIGFWAIRRNHRGNHVRSVLTALKKGEIVGFVMDQYRPGEPKFPFFGLQAKTNTGLAVIARKTKSRIVPAYCVRESFGHHRIYLMESFFMTTTTDLERDINQATVLFNEKIAEMIRLNPEQYLWMHNRWK